MTTIKLKNGSGAPTSGDLVQGEPALDLTNKRLYTEDSGGTVIEVGTNPTSITTGTVTANILETVNGSDIDMDGTASGQLKLDGNGYATAIALNAEGMNVYTNSAARDVILGTNETQRLRVGGNGDISFYEDTGTTAKLFWDASAESLSITGNANVWTIDNTTIYGNRAGGSIYVGNSDATGEFGITSGGSVAMQFDSSGNVGIGTSSPATKLHVNAGTGNIAATFESTDAGSYINLIDNASGTYGAMIGASGDNILFSPNNVEAMRIDSSGNVGIGTSSPVTLLDIKEGTTATDAIIGITAGTGGRAQIRSEAQADNTSSELSFHTMAGSSTNEAMRIDSSGNVGIGESNPAEKLEVAGNILLNASNAEVNLRSGVTGTSGAINWTFNTDASNYASIKLPYDDRTTTGLHIDSGYPITLDASGIGTIFAQSGNEKARIDANGNLLVGTTDTTPFDSSTEQGTVISDGQAQIAGTSTPLYLNRQASDGNIIDFRKNGSTVGSIGTKNGDLVAGTGVTGIGFFDSSDAILPYSITGSAYTTGETDLGINSNRFKDLYLSGGVDISQGSKPQNAFIDNNQTIFDDAVYSFTPDKTIGVIYIYGRNVNYDEVFGIVNYRTASAAFCTLQLNPSSVIGTSTSVLTGTTGTNGLVTISAVQSDGKIYIENRLGKAISIGIHVTGQ